MNRCLRAFLQGVGEGLRDVGSFLLVAVLACVALVVSFLPLVWIGALVAVPIGVAIVLLRFVGVL